MEYGDIIFRLFNKSFVVTAYKCMRKIIFIIDLKLVANECCDFNMLYVMYANSFHT